MPHVLQSTNKMTHLNFNVFCKLFCQFEHVEYLKLKKIHIVYVIKFSVFMCEKRAAVCPAKPYCYC